LGRFPDAPSGDVFYSLSLRFIGVTIPVGSTINSAKITFISTSGDTSHVILKIYGVAEDNTGEFGTSPIDDARTRSHTTANVDWDETPTHTIGGAYDSPDISSIIQEIINRGGWSSGNAIGIFIAENGSETNTECKKKQYQHDSTKAALLTIDYTAPGSSASASLSPSGSQSPSASLSPSSSMSSSISPSASTSASASPSPLPPHATVLRVAKPGINALTNSDPEKMIFDSAYGTLKYFAKEPVNISFDASTLDISAHGTYTHNLGYYPYVEAYVRVYTGSTPSGNYELVPFVGSGASIFYDATIKITDTTIEVYGQINGVSAVVWHFDFLLFVYKNDLSL
jgi:hypothetical protein